MNPNNEPEKQVTNLIVPAEHARIALVDANETYLFGSRGSFKSSIGLSLYNLRRVYEMPRSSGVGVGLSFNHIYENTLPPVKAALLKEGFVEGVHFAISSPPPKNWPKPYLGVLDKKYSNIWSWHNGASCQLVSLMRKASANGVSAQWGWFDEVKFMDQKVLEDEIFPIFRGNEEYFKNCSGYLSKFFATDKEADPVHIKWLLNKRKLVNKQKVEVIIALQVELNALKAAYNQAGVNKRDLLKPQILAIETRLSFLRSNLVYVGEISADDVRPILGDKWYRDKKRISSTHVWNVAFKNQDPDRPGESFYPAWNQEKLTYDLDNDIDPLKPFIIAADYQHTVAPIPIAQLAPLQGQEKVSLNYVDEAYSLYPEGLRAAVKKFCERNKFHPNKMVYYVYDHTAIGKRSDADSYDVIVKDELKKNGWSVIEVWTGQAPGHYQKYLDTIDWMENKDGEYIDIRINRKRCPKLIISITGAAAKTIGKETKKDKDLELEKTLDQSETTHFSDAFDMINDAVLKQKLINPVLEKRPFAYR